MKLLATLLKPIGAVRGVVEGFVGANTAQVWLTFIGVLLALFAVQTARLHTAQATIKSMTASLELAQKSAQLRAMQESQKAVETYEQTVQQDAPVVERVVTRTRDVCLRAKDHLPVSAATPDAGSTRSETQDRADRAWVDAVESDLATCQSELARLDAIRNFHNSQVGAP